MSNKIFFCSFTALSDLRGKQRTYENVKKAVLKSGRFSCFDVNTKNDEKIFTKLCQDAELEITHEQYPWTNIKLRSE